MSFWKRPPKVKEEAARQGIKPVQNLAELACDEPLSDAEFAAFTAAVAGCRTMRIAIPPLPDTADPHLRAAHQLAVDLTNLVSLSERELRRARKDAEQALERYIALLREHGGQLAFEFEETT